MKNKKQFYKKHFLPSGILKKLLVTNIIIGLIPTILLSVFFILHGQDTARREMRETYRQRLIQFMTKIDSKLEGYSRIIYQVAADTGIHNAMTASSSEKNSWINGLIISREIGKYILLDKNLGLETCIIYSEIEEYPVYHSRITTKQYSKYERWYKLSDDLNKPYFFYKKTDSDSYIFSLTQPIISTEFGQAYYGKRLGLIKLDVDLEKIFSLFLSVDSDPSRSIFVFSEHDELLYTNRKELISEDFSSFVQKIEKQGVPYLPLPKTNEKMFCLMQNSSLNYFKVLIAFSDTLVWDKLTLIFQTAAIFTFFSITVIFLLSLYFSKGLTHKLRLLLKKMEQVEQGNLNIKMDFRKGDAEDELTVIEEHFDKMILKLKESINQNYIAEIEKKEAKMRMLQFQINPHFLYNTLETLSAIAMQKKVFIIAEISKNLGEMFRYAISKKDYELVTIQDEIQHIENYLFIEQIRFPKRFQVYYDLHSSVNASKLPCFIIQPLVENAILHGLKDKERGGILRISAYRNAKNIFISVEDNGFGMTETQIADLKTYLSESSINGSIGLYKQSIGLKNVHTRIQLAYGFEYGIDIISQYTRGTQVIIKLPCLEAAPFTLEA